MFCGLEYALLCRDVFITNLLLLRALCVIIEGMQIRLGIDKRPRHMKQRSKSRGVVVSAIQSNILRGSDAKSSLVGEILFSSVLH